MRRQGPFNPQDLYSLGAFLESTDGAVAMREVYEGNRSPRVVGMRHDVDNHPKALDTAVAMGQWEAARGWRSTYFLLHTARYWRDGRWRAAADELAGLGHEIGLHADAIAEALLHGGDPDEMIEEALADLRTEGHEVIGVVGHGNGLSYEIEFANDEQFTECVRPNMGAPDRELVWDGRVVKLNPRPLADFGLKYESIGLRQYQHNGEMRTRPNQLYNTDSGGRWYYPWRQTVQKFEALIDGQLHLLVHPDHWHTAFVKDEVAA